MKRSLALGLALLLLPSVARGDDSPPPSTPPAACTGGTCVSKEDLDAFLQLAKDQKCLKTTSPTFELDPVNIIVDHDGRIFNSGAAPNPYTLRMKWCNYEVAAQGKVNLVAAVSEPPVWSFRFLAKAYVGILPLEAFNIYVDNEAKKLAGKPTTSLSVGDLWDAGVLVDFFHYDWFNLNAGIGFRSFGGGVGANLTKTMTLYLGYANTWGTWHHNFNLAMALNLW